MKELMKRNAKVTVLLFTLALLFVMAGCGKKTYATVGEWYDDNPAAAAAITRAINASGNGESMTIAIEENNIIYRIVMDEETFGSSEEMDAFYAQVFDEMLSADEASIKKNIDAIAQDTGVDASKITIIYEVYNPGASTPGYTKSFKK
ncbi:MAG: hypothetical protein K2H41_07180 [Acetatifactor sp.]|nr:hypothetical protein [Acetatifactor sp.]MDE6701470.1 hypothetical protein [Acetatifactor sp.]MDE7114313.1 hypothetical protein [Acetatifactor sp.]